MTKREPLSERPWSVPLALHEVPEAGRHVELHADERARAAIAKLAGVHSLPRLHAAVDVTLQGREGLRVVGRISATVGQTCVVSLEPIESEIDEAINLGFASAAPPAVNGGAEVTMAAVDGPEPLIDGVLDLGALATEFLLLAIDPYPRKPGAVFEGPSVGDAVTRPFAVLAALKKERGGS